MARRQGGIHFSYLIVAVVMCIGLIGFSFTQNSELQQLTDQRDSAVDQKEQKEQALRDLSTKYDDLRVVTIGSPDREPDLAALRALVDRAGKDIGDAVGAAPVNAGSLEELYTHAITALSTTKQQLDSQTAQSRSKEDESLAHMREIDQIRSDLNDKISELRSSNDTLTTDLERVRAEARDEQTRLQTEIQELEEEWSGKVYQLKRDLAISEGLRDQAEQRIIVLQREINKEKTFAMVEPDGSVIRVEEDLGFAYIDIGQQDRLRRGLIFDVFQYEKGGKRIQKGRVEVARIEGDWAEVKILETYDRFNPIASGDQIASPFYSVDDQPVFVFAGIKPVNNRLSREEIVQKIEAFGGSVEAAVRLETNYVVAMQGYEDTKEYEDARSFGITILREDELLDFIEQ